MTSKLKYLEATRVIHLKLRRSKLSATICSKIRKQLALVMAFFSISSPNAMVLSSIVQESLVEGDVQVKALMEYYGLDSRQVPIVHKAIEELCESGLIAKVDRSLQQGKRKVVPFSFVVDALMTGNCDKVKPKSICGMSDIFTEYNKLQSLRNRGSITHRQFVRNVVKMSERATHLESIQYIRTLGLSKEEMVMILYMAGLTFQGTEMVEICNMIREITDDMGEYYEWSGKFRNQSLAIFKEELVEFCFLEIGIDTEVSLTMVTRERLFASDPGPLLKVFRPRHSKLILPEKIPAVNLIFDKDLEQSMGAITTAMEDGNYERLCARLKERNLKSGLIVLFHGLPGTGKTESVYQLARRTNRAVLRLEISQIKTMWVGESEKNLKKIFLEYKQAKRIYENHPILLFNEADAIFSRRRNVGSTADQMENALQNILLQELEDFEGILFATTNLTNNFDQAFERRFLYRVDFQAPKEESRFRMLSSSFEQLAESDLRSIAASYEFTGSTIENIKRKLTIKELFDETNGLSLQAVKNIIIDECSSCCAAKTPIGFRPR